MPDLTTAHIAVPSCPTLLLDGGSLFTAAVLALPETEADRWPRAELPAEAPVEQAGLFLKKNGLPAPDLTLLCGMTPPAGQPSCPENAEARILRWRDLLHRTEGRPGLFLQNELPGWEADPLLADARRTFRNAEGTDSGAAALLAALSIPSLRDRCWSEGVTVIWAGHSHVQVFMVYQEKLLGLYEQHSSISREALLADLKDLRLNWLPDEQVRAAGGHGCICGDFPAEAEGFRPTWILGPRREALAGCGRMVSPCGDDRFDRCFGLLFGSGLGKTA